MGAHTEKYTENERHIAIVLAAGRGSRMNSTVPKQYMLLSGNPVLYYSIKCMEESFIDDIIIVCGSGDEEYCREQFIRKYSFTKIRAITAGGKERYDSVYMGLKQAGSLIGNLERAYIYIHDGARPCIDEELLTRCREDVVQYNACVPSVPVKDTIKIADKDGFCASTPDRSSLMAVQTPQCFSYDIAWEAYDKLEAELNEEFNEKLNGGSTAYGTEVARAITDDAMVIQKYAGIKVRLSEGSYDNIKITTPEDIEAAENILRRRHAACNRP